MKLRITGCLDNACKDKSGWLSQFVITHAGGSIKLKISDILVRYLVLEIVRILQVEEMADQSPDDAGMHDNE